MPRDAAISISLNGEPATIPAGWSMADMLREYGMDPEQRGSAMALNGRVVRRGLLETTPLNDGDQVEVITAFQGG